MVRHELVWMNADSMETKQAVDFFWSLGAAKGIDRDSRSQIHALSRQVGFHDCILGILLIENKNYGISGRFDRRDVWAIIIDGEMAKSSRISCHGARARCTG